MFKYIIIISLLCLSYFLTKKYIDSYLLESPLEVISISEAYGERETHPVTGKHKVKHKGVDFRAPKGTPIRAAANGVVTFIGQKRGYGNFVIITHSSRLTTSYGHIQKFADKLYVGKEVKQYEVIAYVGNTGQSTGYHLHFEVMVDGKYVDPITFKTIWDK